jgi:hypothetical protein
VKKPPAFFSRIFAPVFALVFAAVFVASCATDPDKQTPADDIPEIVTADEVPENDDAVSLPEPEMPDLNTEPEPAPIIGSEARPPVLVPPPPVTRPQPDSPAPEPAVQEPLSQEPPAPALVVEEIPVPAAPEPITPSQPVPEPAVPAVPPAPAPEPPVPVVPEAPVQEPPAEPAPDATGEPETAAEPEAGAESEAGITEETAEEPQQETTPPAFIPQRPELPNPVSDFRQMLATEPAVSRTVHAKPGQTVEIPFYGSGWSFLGETDGQRGMDFVSRRTDSDGQTFVFKAADEGEYALKFYRRDFLRDAVIDDLVKVIVMAPEDQALPGISQAGTVTAQRWPDSVETARILRSAETGQTGSTTTQQADGATANQQAQTAAETAPQPVTVPPADTQTGQSAGTSQTAQPPQEPDDSTLPPESLAPVPEETQDGEALAESPQQLLAEAETEINAGRPSEAIALLDRFMQAYPEGSDESLWLYGRSLEADGPDRNILAALDSYRRLVRDFPASNRLAEAKRRIAFIERFFINIR